MVNTEFTTSLFEWKSEKPLQDKTRMIVGVLAPLPNILNLKLLATRRLKKGYTRKGAQKV